MHKFDNKSAKASYKNTADSFSYKNSGVNLDEAGRAINLIKKPVFSTFSKNVLNDLTSYAGLFAFDKDSFDDPVLVSSTDGVGTKLLVAKQTGIYKNIGQDLVAMCINDIICCGAVPLFFLDYIACGKIVPEKIEVVVSSMAEACKICRAALIGGEIAEMPDMYEEDDMDLAGFAVGAVDRRRIIKPGLVRRGDTLLGIESSGVHSNGFSLVRKIIKDKNLDLNKNYGFLSDKFKGKKLGEILMEPTKLYFNIIRRLLDDGIKINGVAHITGGGFYENINRIIPHDMDVEIMEKNLPEVEIFSFLRKKAAIGREEMYRVFNMGIGMVIIVNPDDYEKAISCGLKTGERIYRIGRVVSGSRKVLMI